MGEALRKIKPERKLTQLGLRTDGSFFPAASAALSGRFPLVVDTNVYIRNASGTLPLVAADLFRRCLPYHTTVCISEIATGLAALHPNSLNDTKIRKHYETLFQTIPKDRILNPDDDIWTEAGLVAGTLARTQSLKKNQRKEFLNDCLIYLTATKFGIPILTENKKNFDLIQQIVGRGIFIHY